MSKLPQKSFCDPFSLRFLNKKSQFSLQKNSTRIMLSAQSLMFVLISAVLVVFSGCGGGGGGSSNNPPSAMFTATPTSGVAPLMVNLDASACSDSDGHIVSYDWNFGDNTTGTGQIVSKTYSIAGTYTITLTLTDDDNATASVSQQIAVGSNNPPTAMFTALPTSGVAPLMVSLDASACFDSDGHIVSYDWDFGDNTTGTGQTINKTYSTAGTYTITLTLTDNNNATASASEQVVVESIDDIETSINTSNVEGIFASVLQSRRFVNLATAIPYNAAFDHIDTWPFDHTIRLNFEEASYNDLMVNGTVDMTLLETSLLFTGTPPYYIIFDYELYDFEISESDYIVNGNGDIYMRLSNMGQGVQIASLSGELVFLESSGELDILTDYFFVLSSYSNNDFERALAGDIESTRFNDVFSFTSIDTPFTGNRNVSSGNPTAGELHVTAIGDGSQAYIFPQPDGINVQIDIDLNGDDAVDTTVMTTWSELYEIRAN